MKSNKTAEIREDLRRRIKAGEYQPGDRLPSLTELATAYGATSRSAPTRAVKDLVNQGLLTMVHGKGIFVRSRVVVSRDLVAGLRMEYFAAVHGREVEGGLFEAMTGTKTDVAVGYDWMEASEQVAQALDLTPGDEVLRRTFEYIVDGVPHQIARSYLAAATARQAGLTSKDCERKGVGSIAHLHAAAGITVDRGRLRIETRAPTAEESHQLAIPGGTPVFETSRVLFRVDEPVELMTSIIPGDRIGYVFDVDLRETPQ